MTSVRFDYTSGGIHRRPATGESIEPQELWEHLLSRKRALIRRAWESMNGEERIAVKQHLQTMATQAGWHPGQRRAARTALKWIDDLEEKGPAQSGDGDDD